MERTCKIIKYRPLTSFLWFLSVTVLVVFILFPLLCIFTKIQPQDVIAVFSSGLFKQTILNTFIECILSTTLSVFTGYVYAYAIVFARIPFKKFFASLPVLHLVTPPFVGGLSFILLLGRQGLITKTILHLDVSLYGLPGLLIAQTLCFFPLAYLMCKESFESLNKNLVDSAVSLGASKIKIFTKVIFPLTFPALASSFLFIAVSVLSDFGNPMIVGGRFRVLAVEIYTQLTGWTNAGTSSVLGLILLLPSMFLFFLQNRLFNSQTKKIAVIGGKGNTVSGDSAFKNSKTVDILLFIFLSITALCILLQFISIIAGSFQKLWGIDTHFTFNHIKKTFRYIKDFGNTLLFALTGSVLSGLLGAFVSFCVHRTNFPFKNFTDTLIQLPSAVPGTLLGLSYSVTSNILNVHFPRLMITAVITISFMPFSYRMITSAFSKIKFTLDEGALSLGRGPLKIFSRILVPLCKEGIFGGWTYNFARGVGTLSPVIFLVSFNTPLCSVRILNLAEQGDWGRAAALALELTIITFIIIGFGKYLQKNPFSKNQHLMGKIYE